MLQHSSPGVPTHVLFSSLQHSDGTFCVKPLKQKQVVSVGVSLRWWQPPCTPCRGGTEGFWGAPKSHKPVQALPLPPRECNFEVINAKRTPGCLGGSRAGPRRGSGQGVSAPHPLPVGLQVDGVSYLLQEIYGIENKYNTQDSKVCACIPGLFPHPSFPSLPLAQVWPLKRAQGQSLQHSTELVMPWGHFVLALKLLEAES